MINALKMLINKLIYVIIINLKKITFWRSIFTWICKQA